MKRGLLSLIIILFLSACQQRQSPGEKIPVASPEPAQVIDQPAAVVLDPAIASTTGDENYNGSIQQILASFHIPLISSSSGNLEFVKRNGDKVRIDLHPIRKQYDLILFDAENDPLPVNFKDLEKSASRYFPRNTPGKIARNAKQAIPEPVLQNIDSLIEVSKVPDSLRPGRQKTLVLPVPDTAKSFSHRDIPGIRWVEERIDTRSNLSVIFENDLITYANTDRYFTNGVTFRLQSAWISQMKLARLMIPYRHPSRSVYSLQLVQNMYTPRDTRIEPTFDNDRPYSSILVLGYSKQNIDANRKIKITNEAWFGYLGPYSPGAYLQTLVHKTFPTNDKPLGWESQIKTDVILNYNISLEKTLISRPGFEFSGTALARAGTLYTQGGAGFNMHAGKFESNGMQTLGPRKSAWQYYFFIHAEGYAVGYDATLQGGLLNRDNIFVLKAGDVRHLVGKADFGFRVSYKGTGIELAQHWLTSEFDGGLSHKWGRIQLIFNL